MADNVVTVVDNRLYDFLTDVPWDSLQINNAKKSEIKIEEKNQNRS